MGKSALSNTSENGKDKPAVRHRPPRRDSGSLSSRTTVVARGVAYLLGALSLAWVLVPVKLMWLPGPSNEMLASALFPVSFLFITGLNSVMTRLGILSPRGFALWFDTLSYAVLLLALKPVAASMKWDGFSPQLGLVFVSGIAVKFSILFGAIYRALREKQESSDVRLPTAVFLMSFLFCFLMGLYPATKVFTQPDEPFYLLIAQSILYDRDLDLNNNLEAKQYHAYYPSELLPQRDVNKKGEYISRHGAFYSVLILPLFAMFGRIGPMAFSCLAYALFCVLLFNNVPRGTFCGRSAFWVWIAALISTNGLIFSTQIYPESLACLLIMVLLTSLMKSREKRSLLGVLVVAALLPWLKARYALIGFPIVGFLLLEEWAMRRAARSGRSRPLKYCPAAAIGLVCILSLCSAILFYAGTASRMFGALTLQDVVHLDWSRCWYRIFGLFLDYQFGLLTVSPVFLLSFLGLFMMIRQGHRFAGITTCCVIPYLLLLASLHWWYGGGCPPGRYFVCLLPFLVLNMSFALSSSKRLITRALFAISLAYTVAISFVLTIHPQDRYADSSIGVKGATRLLDRVRPVAAPVPSFITGNTASYLWALGFTAALVLLYVVGKRLTRQPRSFRGTT